MSFIDPYNSLMIDRRDNRSTMHGEYHLEWIEVKNIYTTNPERDNTGTYTVTESQRDKK